MDIKAYEDFLQIVDSIAGSEMSFRYEVERERGYKVYAKAVYDDPQGDEHRKTDIMSFNVGTVDRTISSLDMVVTPPVAGQPLPKKWQINTEGITDGDKIPAHLFGQGPVRLHDGSRIAFRDDGQRPFRRQGEAAQVRRLGP